MKGIQWLVLLATLSVVAVAQDQEKPFEGRPYYIPLQLEFGFEDGLFRYVNYYESEGLVSPASFPSTMSGPYELRDVEGFTVARVQFPTDTRDLFLFYAGKQLIVYDTQLGETLLGQQGRQDGVGLFPIRDVEASSFFSEILGGKEVRYVAENLTDSSITNQWVEGVAGYGEGETLFVRRGGDHVVLLNGFFAPQQPTLYRDNGRLKRVLVRGYDERGIRLFEELYSVPDVPNLYPIQFPMRVESYEIEIVEVYPGRRFEDTAISGLFFDGHRNQVRLMRERGE